ncbi:MAG: hypothetical protein DRR42_13860 [Gammaproteobacteria bacterium]|nr:MAG: hypothetical protein DRR42_13860 [Gammaproteobacteria bacterium]
MEIALQTDEVTVSHEKSSIAVRQLNKIFPSVLSRLNPDKAATPLFTTDRFLSSAEMVAQVALALQREFGFEVEFARGRSPTMEGTAEVCYQHSDPVLGVLVGRMAVVLVREAASDDDKRMATLYDQSINSLKNNAPAVLTRRIVWEAEKRNIPWSRIHATEGYVQLGHGYKQRRFNGSYTGNTPYIATKIATAKYLACDFFRSHGIPVPQQIRVLDADGAVAAALRIGYPVVLKPERMDKGLGVHINLIDEQSVREAFDSARSHGRVLIEQQIPGDDYRITLIHGRMVAAGRSQAAQVVGDGHSTIRKLIEIVNSDLRRGTQDYCELSTIVADDEIIRTLEEQKMTLDSKPETGTIIALRRWWRNGTDHSAEDMTGLVHPINRTMFERAARLIGLDIAGVDFITPDISRPWTEVGGAINEINPTPGLNTHIRAGAPAIIPMVVDTFFPVDEDGRIPTAAVCGTVGTARRAAEILESTGYKVGLATTQGVEIDKTMVTEQDSSGLSGAHMVLGDPLTSAAVLQLSVGKIKSEGLAVDKIGVGAVMDPGTDDKSGAQVEVSTELESSMGLIVKAAQDLVILSADDPLCTSLASLSQAKSLCLIASNPDSPLMADHINKGGLAITVTDIKGVASICLWDRQKATVLAPVAVESKAAEQILIETMFAIAITYGLNVLLTDIAVALNRTE